MSTSLSVILPCRNQAEHIGKLLPAYFAPLDSLGLPYELVVVPNACTDATADIVTDLARHEPRLRVVVSKMGGWGRAVLAGAEAASGSLLMYTNSARTDPEILPRFVQAYLHQGPGLVKARRCQRQAPARSLGSLLYNLESRVLFNIRHGDVNGTPKILSRDLYRQLQLTSKDDLIDLELMAKAARRGVKVVEIPVAGFRRHGGHSSTTLGSAWKMYAGAVQLWWSLRPAWKAHKRDACGYAMLAGENEELGIENEAASRS